MKNSKDTKTKSEEFKNSTGLNIIIPKNDKTVNYDRLNRVASLIRRTQRI